MAPPVSTPNNSSNNLGYPSGSIRYYKNCRGVNYLPPLESEWRKSGYFPRIPNVPLFNVLVSPSFLFPVSSSYMGTNKTTQWWYYNDEDNENSLKYLRSIGINAVRTFSNIYVWARDRTKYMNAIDSFHKLCEKYKMRVQWVLWDHVEIPPDYIAPSAPTPVNRTQTASSLEYGLLNKWTAIPHAFEVSSQAQANNFFTTCATPFINDMASSLSGYQSLWSFDMINEGTSSTFLLASSTSLLLSSLLSSVNIGITFGHGESFQPYSGCGVLPGGLGTGPGGTYGAYPNDFFNYSSFINFASIHCYSNTRVGLVRYINEALSGAAMIGKPAMFNETHYPDNLQWARNDLLYFSAYRFGGLGFDGLTDRSMSFEPFLDSQGVFFADGTVKNLSDALTYINLADGENWFSPSQLNRLVEEKTTSTNNGEDGGYYSGVIPEHQSFNADLYVSTTSDKWDAAKTFYYTTLPITVPITYGTALVNPAYSKNFPPYKGDPNAIDLGYSFTSSGVDYEQAHNMLYNWDTYFPPLSSLPNAVSGPVFQAKNKSVILRTLLLDLLQKYALDMELNYRELRQSPCDPSRIPYTFRESFVSSFSSVKITPTLSPTPGVNSILGTSSTIPCVIRGDCLTTGGSIDWAAYDAIYSTCVDKLKTCLTYITDASVSDDKYRLF